MSVELDPRTAELERRIGELEAQLAGLADRAQPDTISNVAGQVVAADGSVSYDFDGHVRARGLDLLASTALAPPDDRQVRWLDEATGAQVAQLYTSRVAGVDLLSAGLFGTASDAAVGLVARGNRSTDVSELELVIGAQKIVLWRDGGGSNRESGLLQLADQEVAQTAIDVGSVAIAPNPKVVPHTLGRIPQAVLVTPVTGFGNITFYVAAATAADFTIAATAAGSTVYWLAIG